MTSKEFKIQVLPYSNKLLRFAILFLKDDEQAKDVVQDIFLKLWQKRDELKKIENIEAFAMRMTRNRCLDLIRANRSVPVDEQQSRLYDEQQSDPDKEMELTESARLVRRVIQTLPETQRQVIWMRDIEQLEYDEIAGVLEIEANALRVNLSRARKKVRDELLKYQNYGIERRKNIVGKVF